MASTTSPPEMANVQLPPSPPPSPQAARRRHERKKKKADPFEELALTPLPSRPSTPENLPGQEDESILTKIVLTPILFVSFVISLFWVNRRNRARRSQAHTTYSSLLSSLAPSTWLDPEPYQDPTDSTWGQRGDTPEHAESYDVLSRPKGAGGQSQEKNNNNNKKKKKSWHLNKKIRKVAKLEVSDAFEMRGRVMAIVLFLIVLATVAIWTLLKWIVLSMSNMMAAVRS